MQVTIKKSNLLKAYNLVGLVVEQKTTLAILSTVLFDVKEDSLTLVGTNLTARIEVKIPAIADGEFQFCLGKTLDVIRKFDNDEITFELKETKLTMKSGKRKHQISYSDPQAFPMKQTNTQPTYRSYEPIEFARLFDKVSNSLATDISREFATGFYANNEVIMTTDGYRASVLKLDNFTDNPVVLSSKFILPLLSHIVQSSELNYSLGTENFIKGKSEGFEWEAIFPAIDATFPKDSLLSYIENSKSLNGLSVELETSTLKRELDIVETYWKQSSTMGGVYFLNFEVGEGKFFVTINVPDLVDMRDEVETEILGDFEKLVSLNPSYFLGSVNKIAGDKCQIKFCDDSDSPIFLFDNDDKDYVYFQMPARQK